MDDTRRLAVAGCTQVEADGSSADRRATGFVRKLAADLGSGTASIAVEDFRTADCCSDTAGSSASVDCSLGTAQLAFDCYQRSSRRVVGSPGWTVDRLEVGCTLVWALVQRRKVVGRVPKVFLVAQRWAKLRSRTNSLDSPAACDCRTTTIRNLSICFCCWSPFCVHRRCRSGTKAATRRSQRFEFCFSVVAAC